MFVIGALRLVVLIAVVAASAMLAAAQDLGSSNKLFGGGSTKKAPAKTTTKKPAAKPKSVTSKAKAPAKKAPAAAKSTKTSAAATKGVKKPVATQPPTEDWTWRDEIKAADTAITKPAITTPAVTDPAAEAQFEDLIDEGNRARDDRNYPVAEAAYKRARGLKVRDSRAVYGLGNLYSDQQRWTEAEAAYREALQIESGFAITHIALSYVLTQPIPTENLGDRYEEAERLARRAIQYAPSNALAHDQLGVAMELRGIISAETENAYRRAIQLDASFPPAYAHLGRLLRRTGQMEESAAAYRDAVRLATDVSTMVLVADVMQSEQRFAESEQLLQKAVANDPRNPSALFLLGRALMAQNKLGAAEDVLRTSLEVSPNTFIPNNMLGSLFMRQGRLELAENALLQALRFVPSVEKRLLSRQFESLGDAFVKSSNSRFAERNFRQALALDPTNTGITAKLARVKQD